MIDYYHHSPEVRSDDCSEELNNQVEKLDYACL